MIIVSVIIIFLVYLIINHIFYLRKNVEGVTSRSEKSRISEINTKTENNDISLNSLKNFSDTISTRCAKGVGLLIAVPTKDDSSTGKKGSAYNTHERLKNCLFQCQKPEILVSKKKRPPRTKAQG